MDYNKPYPNDLEYHVDGDGSSAQTQQVSVGQLQRLVRLLDESDVSEIEVKRVEEGMHLVLRKAKAQSSTETGTYAVQNVPPVADSAATKHETGAVDARHSITAPLVGSFHTWGKPKGKALVAVGDRVKVGQLVGSIQSLNVISEVESSIAGRVAEILVQDGQPVEYGQPLVVIDSSEEA
ncbi:acetyl-CoA carboxylase biotin carboxyl carrier protein [Dictyobacter arantiisoli]|uniref:Biotin carboxyl carrier protein of acetyl-CoA carboxylase n=1 Tax=Dictyobacter arantiisoli TaxID=2014874 RepID=A0A5A5T9Y6_9CHLR|nr:biotin/lipoyl-containing protein [Dictyobacter arantiisoli]GCF08232.1 acetyl-CoA carboxylase, biotin carboxyl carrier protein [Dictyobacter arantiisoli]